MPPWVYKEMFEPCRGEAKGRQDEARLVSPLQGSNDFLASPGRHSLHSFALGWLVAGRWPAGILEKSLVRCG